ncbi:MAG TPA: AAA family ATPase [bacterium]|nr:AAA family ATPase [bacterium]
MLRELHIENFAIIDKAHLKFEDAINLITGETGAGKSLLIDALRIIGGGRTNNSCIKAGAEQSQITAIFDAIPQAKRILENLAIKTEEYIYIRRIISQKSAAKNFINDTMVSANALKELFEVLVEMHGQFENQKLLTPKNQLNYLDSYAKTEKELKEYFEQYQKLENLKKNIENIKKINLSPAEIEWKNHQISELSKIKTTDEEYDEILSKIKIADKSNVLIEYLAKTTNILYDSKDSANSIINKCIAKIEEIDNGCRAKTIIELLNSINNLISSANAEIKDYIEVLNNYIGNFDAL